MNLHNTLLNNGFKVTSAPDEATIYTNAEGTTVIIEEPNQKEIQKVILSRDAVTGDCTSDEAQELLIQAIIKRDAR